MFDLLAFAQGLALGLGVFVVPGPKDLVVLRQALRRRPTAELLAIGIGSDALLIALGIAGISLALQQAPGAQRFALGVGVGLMLWHGAMAIRRAAVGSEVQAGAGSALEDRAVLLSASLLNPVAWMDTVLVIGTAGAAMPGPAQPSYGLGAVAASAAWFMLLTLGARQAGRCLADARARRGIDLLVALAMIGMALHVGAGLL